MTKYIDNSILTILFISFLFSQNKITGIVLNKETKLPLYNASIFIEGTAIGTTSNQEGYFELNLNEKYMDKDNLNIKMIGYEILLIPLNSTNNKIDLGKLYLVAESIKLKPIHIHSKNNSANLISNITISGQKLSENLKSNIASTLSNHPSIGINSIGVVTSKPSLRGFSGDRFLLTKDGNQTGDLSQSSIDHAIALDMAEVDMIEIVRGPKSLIFGSNAIGGVVNTSLIGSPKVRVDRPYAKFLIGDESFNKSRYWNTMFYLPIEDAQLNTYLSNRKTNNQTSPIGVLENTESYTTNHKVGFTIYNKDSYVNFIKEMFEMAYGIPPTSNGHIDGVDIDMNMNSYHINYHKDIEFINFEQLDMKYNFIDYDHKEYINNEFSYHVLLAKKTNNFKIEISQNQFLFGYELTRRRFEPDGFYLTPTTIENQYSFYSFYDKKIEKFNFDFLSSIRIGGLFVNPGEYNYTNGNSNLILKDNFGNPILDEDGNKISLVRNRKFNNTSFSFGIRKEIQKIELNSWIMHTMRPPRVEELFSDGPHLASYAFEIGNPDLKTEKIYGIENSIKYRDDKFELSFVSFYNYSPYYFEMTKNGNCEVPDDWEPWTTHPCYGADWIDWGSGGLGWLHKYSAKGNEVTIKGLEFDFDYNFQNLNFSYNFSMVHGDNITTERPLSYMNPNKQIVEINYKRKFFNHLIRVSKIHSQHRLGEFETPTPAALLTDYVLRYNFNRHNIIIQVNNIFNEIYYNHLSRIKNITPEAGQNIHLVYKIMI